MPDGDMDPDILECIAELMDNGEVEDWAEAYEICSTDVARARKVSQVERRAAALEIRAAGRGLTGYAAVFGVAATIKDYTETIMPGAFRHTLAANRDVVALQDHMSNRPLGRTRSGTLHLREDARGLQFDISLPDTTYAHDLLEIVRRGDAGGCSFGFVAIDERWNGDIRELRSIDLREISIITGGEPAYTATSVQARSRPRPAFPRVAVRRRFLESIR